MWSGDEAFIRVYSYYVGTGGHESEYVRQFRITLCDHEHGYAVGFGQRDWQFVADGDEGGRSLVGIHRVERVIFRQTGLA